MIVDVGEPIAVGETVRITITVNDGSTAAGMRMRVKRRDTAIETELSVTPSGAVAVADFTPTVAGYWDWRAWRTGNPASAKEGTFFVEKSKFGADPP